MHKCFSCARKLTLPGNPGRRDACPYCGADIRVCYNCAFFDEKAYNECSEPVAERVIGKDKANFCDYFKWGEGALSDKKESIADAKKKLDDLF